MVPEPATWAMMLIGFGAVGWQIRRRGRPIARVRGDVHRRRLVIAHRDLVFQLVDVLRDLAEVGLLPLADDVEGVADLDAEDSLAGRGAPAARPEPQEVRGLDRALLRASGEISPVGLIRSMPALK